MAEKLLQVKGSLACLIVALLLLGPGPYALAQLANPNAADSELQSRLAEAKGLIAQNAINCFNSKIYISYLI